MWPSVSLPPFITTQPQLQVVNLGQSAHFSVIAGGAAPLGYQWRFQGNDIPGATDLLFTIGSTHVSDAGAYSVVVTNIAGSVTSSDAFLFFVALFAVGDNSFGGKALSLTKHSM